MTKTSANSVPRPGMLSLSHPPRQPPPPPPLPILCVNSQDQQYPTRLHVSCPLQSLHQLQRMDPAIYTSLSSTPQSFSPSIRPPEIQGGFPSVLPLLRLKKTTRPQWTPAICSQSQEGPFVMIVFGVFYFELNRTSCQTFRAGRPPRFLPRKGQVQNHLSSPRHPPPHSDAPVSTSFSWYSRAFHILILPSF